MANELFKTAKNTFREKDVILENKGDAYNSQYIEDTRIK